MSDIVERLRARNGDGARQVVQPDLLVEEAVNEILDLRSEVFRLEQAVKLAEQQRWYQSVKWDTATMKCPVCDIGGDGRPTAYACQRNDCPARAT